jgi:hypothetical protein
MRDSFDHGKEEKLSNERMSLLGGDFEGGEGVGGGEDFLLEFQDRSCLKGSVVIEMYDPEPVDRRERVNRPSSLSSEEEPNSARGSTFDGDDDVRLSEWRCEYSSCGRLFQKRHELK